MSSNSKPKTVIQQTPPSLQGKARVDLNKSDFDALVEQKGYDVYIDKALKCPCRTKTTSHSISSCRNCGGSGWVFLNRYQSRVVLQSMNMDTKYKDWSEERLGTAKATFRKEEEVSFMDRITLINAIVPYNEILHPTNVNQEENLGETLLIGKVKFDISTIEYIFTFTDSNQPLTILVEDQDFTIDVNQPNILIFDNKYSQIEDFTVSIRYKHHPSFHVIDLVRDVMVTQMIDKTTGSDVSVYMPIHAVCRRSNYVLDEENISNTYLFDNSFNVSCIPVVQQGTLCSAASYSIVNSSGFVIKQGNIASGGFDEFKIPDTPVTVRNISGDVVGSGDVPSVTGGVVTVPDCQDGTVNVNKSNGDLIQAVTVASGGTEPYNVADSTAVLKDSAGTTISTTSIKATESEDIPAPDTTLQVNGVTEGTHVAGSTIGINLSDGTNPVTPDSVTKVGDNYEVVVPAPTTGWVRNPDWLPLPELTAVDNRFVGLFLVFEGEYNQLALNLTNNAVNIDWGDGTSDVSNGAVQTKVYDYATIVSPVSQYYDGRNYKQIIVDLEYNGTGTWIYCHLSFNTGINNGGSVNFVDIDCSLPNVNNLFLSQQRKMTILEQLKVRTLANNSWNSTAVLMWKLRSLEFPFDKLTQMVNSTFQGVEHFGNIDLGNVLNAAIGFSGSTAISFGNINLSSSTSIQRLFEQAKQLIRVESIDCSSCTTIQQAFNSCDSLNYVVLNNCALITITTNAFNACFNLSTLLLNGITVGFSIANGNLTDTALNDLFTSLGTASGSQTIIVTGNPGAATCDTTIATAKGFTVTT